MHILISGAGIAGLSAAIDLEASGHDVSIVERANHLRVNGSPIDIRGDAIDVAKRMGVLDDIHAHRIDMSERVQFVDRTGAAVAEIPEQEINDSADDIEIPREDLTKILHARLGAETELLFGDSIAGLRDDGTGVDVDFSSGRTDRYDLVIGADGMHSAVRRLTFGAERQFLHHLGLYVALADLPDHSPSGRTNPMYNYPGHLVGIAAFNDQALAIFSFRSSWIDYDYHDLQAQKQIIADAFPCRCGVTLENKPLEGIDAKIHRCGACGAQVAANAESCGYCASEIVREPGELSLICPECFARNEEQSRQNLGAGGWSLSDEQARRLTESAATEAAYPAFSYRRLDGFAQLFPAMV